MEMLHKLKILTLMQLSEKIKLKEAQTVVAKLAKIGRTILAMAVSYGLFTGVFYVIFNILFLRATQGLFVFILFFMQIISIINCTTQLSYSLYTSKDNMLLLTYPVKSIYVYISKIFIMYILELIKSLILTFPLFMAFATIGDGVMSFQFIIGSVVFSILLPLFPVLIGALLSIPVVYVSQFIKKYSIVKAILSIVLIIGLVFFTRFLVSIMPEEIRLLALWNTFLEGFEKFLLSVDRFTLYCSFIGKSLFNENVFVNDLLILLCLVLLVGLCIVISIPLFFKLASSASENAVSKKHKGENKAHKSTFLTFMRKELTLSIRNIADFIDNYLFLFLMPFVLILMANLFVRIDRNDLGIAMTYGFIGLITLVMLSASNTASATAISSEGNEFVLLKTSPGKTNNIVWAKLLINFVLSLIALLITFIILSIKLYQDIDLVKLWIEFFYIVIIDFGLILWSIQLDILNPNLREYENSQSRSSVKNGSTSITIGLISSLLLSALLILVFLFRVYLSHIIIKLAIVSIAFSGIRLYLLINYMNAYFEDIQL